MTRQQIADRVATAVLWAAGILILLILAGFLLPILIEGLPVVDWQFLTTRSSAYRAGGGVGAQLFNTIYITGLSLLFSLPVGVGAGIYMAEYAKPGRMTDLIRLSVEALASVPSIVLGLFGMILFVNYMGWGFTILGGSLSLALLNLPVLVRNTEEAVRAVPQSYREGSLGLGAGKWHMVRTVVLPNAVDGIVTGCILAVGRIVGESAALLFTAGFGLILNDFFTALHSSSATLTVALYVYANERGETGVAFAIASILMVLTFLINMAANLAGRKLKNH
jgi:phosphate transport system permease protein